MSCSKTTLVSLILAAFAIPAFAQMAAPAGKIAVTKYDRLPLAFERRGSRQFTAHARGYTVGLRDGQATIHAPGSELIRMGFVGGRRAVAVVENELAGKANYIIGNDPKRWQVGLSTYERVRYRNVYPGVDVVYYGNQEQVEFDLALQPGADARSMRLRFSPAAKIDESLGDLVVGDFRLKVPRVFQGNRNIPARYRLLEGGEVAFDLGDYDARSPLTIDPTLVCSTRLGGGNYSQANAVAIDAAGNAYIAGYTDAADFATVSPAFAGYQANADGFISKINSTGTALIYSTYIGGSNDDHLQGIAVDPSGAAWAVGYTSSVDFPLLSPLQSALGGGYDAVVVRLSPTGALAYSTYLGGPSTDYAYSVAVDPSGNAYVGGLANRGFPTTSAVYESSAEHTTGFVTKFAPSGALAWSTLVGGDVYDWVYGIAVDEFGNAYVTGSSYSSSFPHASPGGAQQANHGSGDAFVAKLNFNGSALLYVTFLGGSGYDAGGSIAVDPASGIAAVAGWTTSLDLPVTAGALQTTTVAGYHGFAAKLNASGSAFVYVTYLGGNRKDLLLSVALDANGNTYVAGYSDSNTFPTGNAIQPAIQGNSTSLFRTTDGGATWSAFDGDLPGAISTLSPDPANAGALVASTENGTFRTVNGGATWTQQTTVQSLYLSRSPANPSTIYGLNNTTVYQSTDAGVTWVQRGSLASCCVEAIIADPTNPNVAYVTNPNGSTLPAVQKTTDNGATWSAAITGLPAGAQSSAMVASSDGTLYLGLYFVQGGSPGGLYKSTDHAATWTPVTKGLYSGFNVPRYGLAVAPSNPSILYLTDYFNLYESTNAGGSWIYVGSLPGGTSALAVSSNNPSTLLYAAYNSTSQMWVSSNAGVTWTPSPGVGVASIYGIVADPLNGASAYAGASVSVLPVIAKIETTGHNLLYSTFLGGYGAAYGLAKDSSGDVFVAGSTWQIPTTPSAVERNRNNYDNVLDAFVAKISDATGACTYSVDAPQYPEIWYPHFIQYVVTAPSGCVWNATSNQPWATIASGASGTGSGIVYVLLDNDTTAGTRTANLSIAGQAVTLNQRPGSCGYNVFSPEAQVVPGSGGPLSFNLSVSSGCQWSVATNDSTAVTFTSAVAGAGNGSVSLTVAPNPGPNTRTLIVYSPQGDQETISQAGTTAPAVVATVTSTPPGASITVTGAGCIPGTFTTPATLTWNANTNCTVFFTTPQSIGGSTYSLQSASVNGGAPGAVNPLVINSGSSAVSIKANFMAPCTYSLSSGSESFTPAGGLGFFTVTTAAACSWSPSVNVGWITLLPSGSKGTGPVSFAVLANGSGAARSGVISVAGQQFQVTQAGFSCSYSISPATGFPPDAGGVLQVEVSAPSGCAWRATSNVGWVTVTSGASGSGTGVVKLSVGANSGGQRSGTVTIAGQTYTVTEGAGACGAVDVTNSEVAVTPGSFIFESAGFGDSVFGQQVTLVNGPSPVAGPLYYVMVGLPQIIPGDEFGSTGLSTLPPGTTFTSCFGPTSYLIPIASLVPGLTNLAPGQTISFGFDFVRETPPLNYTPKVLSGKPSH